MKTDDDIKKNTNTVTDESLLVNHVKYEWEHGYQYLDTDNQHYDDIYKMLRGQRPEKTL